MMIGGQKITLRHYWDGFGLTQERPWPQEKPYLLTLWVMFAITWNRIERQLNVRAGASVRQSNCYFNMLRIGCTVCIQRRACVRCLRLSLPRIPGGAMCYSCSN